MKNSQIKINEFQQYLETVIKKDPKRYSYLLQNLPRFNGQSVPKNLSDADAEENSDAFLLHSEEPGSFILKFLRAGNYKFEMATKISFG